MFNPTKLVIDAFVDQLKANYHRTYGLLEPEYPNIVGFVGRMALENIANSDAAYHDVAHTILVTEVGMEILRGRHILEGGVSPRDWLHFVIALLCHDIGYVRGVCSGDRDGRYVVDENGTTIALPEGATDASLTAYHVTRSKLFIQERFGRVPILDTAVIKANIEHTRFPVPDDDEHRGTTDYPGLLRASDLIGQLADINYLRKSHALFTEFSETGAAAKLGYKTAADLRAGYPGFFWRVVSPFIQDALRYLKVTQEGKQWIANLYAHVFAEEHRALALGPERAG
ncbi:MAG TPA: metal-dependent phosphohydrolase [Alphaproteobacteria bacterium]|nr:metal-dependent phosphohydrolase [Alphaproteobacteria bacterium]